MVVSRLEVKDGDYGYCADPADGCCGPHGFGRMVFLPLAYLVIFGVPVALGFIAAGVLRLCHPILSGWGWVLVAMSVAVTIVVCGVGYVVIGAPVVNEVIRFEGLVPAYVILLIVNVLVQAAEANLLVDRRRRRQGAPA